MLVVKISTVQKKKNVFRAHFSRVAPHPATGPSMAAVGVGAHVFHGTELFHHWGHTLHGPWQLAFFIYQYTGTFFPTGPNYLTAPS